MIMVSTDTDVEYGAVLITFRREVERGGQYQGCLVGDTTSIGDVDENTNII